VAGAGAGAVARGTPKPGEVPPPNVKAGVAAVVLEPKVGAVEAAGCPNAPPVKPPVKPVNRLAGVVVAPVVGAAAVVEAVVGKEKAPPVGAVPPPNVKFIFFVKLDCRSEMKTEYCSRKWHLFAVDRWVSDA